MAKRMTDTDKWKKPFIKSLPTELKLFYLYLLDDCDHAGIWHVDIEVAEIRLGVKINSDVALGCFGEKIIVFDGGSKWFIPDFITFQYGELTEKNKMFKPVSSLLSKYNLMGHISPIYGGKDKDKVKDKEIVKEKEAEETVKFPIDHCAMIASNDQTWVHNSGFTGKLKDEFLKHLKGSGEMEKNPADFKKHFWNWKTKQPEDKKPLKLVFK